MNKIKKHKISKKNNIKLKKHKKIKTHKKGGNYIYFPQKNVIQFLPYSYPDYSPKSMKIYNKVYSGNQAGGNLLPQTCSDFNPNMLQTNFNCFQPFWDSKCT